ncbi:MAG: glycosyltransferase family 2 protein [Polyangiaceae bacterium]|nr:glycosyltransferase family 2 protein [Polyangiaceae bacterium]
MGLSIVVPVYNEVGSLPELYGRINDACRSLARPFEVVFVDDGSTDGSSALLDRMAEVDERITVIHFRRNFGKSPALAAAFEKVNGPIVITMDADLQDDPAMIPAFVERIEAGADLVSGWKQRRNDPLDKTLPSKLFNAVVRRVSGVPLRDFNCGFKAYRIECIRELNVYGGLHRFLPVLAGERGFRIEELVVQHHARKHGVSKFGARRFVDGFLDLLTVLLLTRYRMKPLHFFGAFGALAGALGFTILAYLTVLWMLGHGIGTRPLLTLGVLLTVTSGQFLGLGLLGELLVRTTVDRREIFSVRDLREGRQAAPERSSETPTILDDSRSELEVVGGRES